MCLYVINGPWLLGLNISLHGIRLLRFVRMTGANGVNFQHKNSSVHLFGNFSLRREHIATELCSGYKLRQGKYELFSCQGM